MRGDGAPGATNIEVVVQRLRDDDYRFHCNDAEQTPAIPFVRATGAANGTSDWLQRRVGLIPMTVLAWMRSVGDVWLVGTHPEWPESASADPIVIELEGSRHPGTSIREYFASELEDWREQAAEDLCAGPFVLPVAPDRLHKQNFSGGAPYGIVLPDRSVDGQFVGQVTMPFVSYLNLAFDHGGFPWSTASKNATPIKQALAKDLLPL